MKPATALILLLCCHVLVHAQIAIDVPLHFTGTGMENGVSGLAGTAQPNDLMTVEGAVQGVAHWCQASASGNTIELSGVPVEATLSDATLLRFKAPATQWGEILISTPSGVLPLFRPDRSYPAHGQIVTGRVCEVVLFTDTFFLTAPIRSGCPPSTVTLRGPACMDSTMVTGMTFYVAAAYCAEKGGRLCTWQEYYQACHATNEGLPALFTVWEWSDDTANHGHSVAQVGRTTCMSQRTTNPSVTGGTRCCYNVP